MNSRRQLYEIILRLPDPNPARRIAAIGEFLDAMPAEKAAAAERKILALAIVYEAEIASGSKSSLSELFANVEALERRLMN